MYERRCLRFADSGVLINKIFQLLSFGASNAQTYMSSTNSSSKQCKPQDGRA